MHYDGLFIDWRYWRLGWQWTRNYGRPGGSLLTISFGPVHLEYLDHTAYDDL